MNLQIIKLGNGIVIPSSHDAPSVGTVTNHDLLKQLKSQANNGYYYEGCGEDNCGGGEGRERDFLSSLGIDAQNNGSFDDLDLGYYNGYVMFSNIEANKNTLKKLLNIKGDTVEDVIIKAAEQGIATQNNLPVSNIDDFKNLLENNFSKEQLSAEPLPHNIIKFLKEGESLMWDNYDIATGGPEGSLANYAKQGTKLRRENLKNKLENGGIAFIGDGHIPELQLDFPNDTEVIGKVTHIKDKLQEQITRIKQVMGINEERKEPTHALIEILPSLAYMDEKYRYQVVPHHATKEDKIYIKKGSAGNKSISTKNIKVIKSGSEEEMKNHLSKLKNELPKKEETKEGELTERCWPGYTQKGMKTMFGKRYPNCVKKSKK